MVISITGASISTKWKEQQQILLESMMNVKRHSLQMRKHLEAKS